MKARDLIYLAAFIVVLVSFAHSVRTKSIHDSTEAYRAFNAKPTSYYAEIAICCDSLLKKYSPYPEIMRISDMNETIPKILRDLKVPKISLYDDYVMVEVGAGPTGFLLSWTPDVSQTNLWVLRAETEFSQKTVYSREK